jgi:hypothetical protein
MTDPAKNQISIDWHHNQRWNGTPVPPEQWGADHYSTIGYVFCCLGNGTATPQASKMRQKPNTPRRGVIKTGEAVPFSPTEYPTKLQGGEKLYGHDDFDCLFDAEAVGLILENKGSGMFPVIHFTDAGLRLGQWLCEQHDQERRNWRDITWDECLAVLKGA